MSESSFWKSCGYVLFILVGSGCLSSSGSCHDIRDRPCGPSGLKGPLRYLIPQGIAGADFRPACRKHDRCYGTLGSRKTGCDRRFLGELTNSCKNSRHPVLCRVTARLMYLSLSTEASLKAFGKGQKKALLRLHPE